MKERNLSISKFSPHGPHGKIVRCIGENKRVLDVGCGDGILAKELKRNGCQVIAIEMDKEKAELAKQYCDDMIIGNVEEIESLPYPRKFFDIIVYGDVLQYLKKPDQVLVKLRKYLAPHGHVIASVPNVARLNSRVKMLLGMWDFEEYWWPSRYYTSKTIKQLFTDNGYRIVKADYTGLASKYRIFKILPTWFSAGFVILAEPKWNK